LASKADKLTTLVFFPPENDFILTDNLKYSKAVTCSIHIVPVREKAIAASTAFQDMPEAVVVVNFEIGKFV